jgi:hypothetical protein
MIDFPSRKNLVGSKWVFNKKLNAKGKVGKYKSHLVAKGYSWVERIDFGEIFSLVAKLEPFQSSSTWPLCISNQYALLATFNE